MSFIFDPACLQCHFARHLKRAASLGDDKTAMAFARELMQLYIDAPEDVTSPWFMPMVEKLFDKYYHLGTDQYRAEKEQANRFVLERLPQVRQLVAEAEDPVYAGLQFAILGNYLDFSALQGNVSFEKLEQMLRSALDLELDRAVFAQLRRELAEARKLLYLTDNAGEIGMDRIFAEEIQKAYPQLEITFCVRGGIIINDATREDAELVGIPFRVIDNGNLVPGTDLNQIGDEAREAMESADVIIAKGMANTETLHGCGYNIYYAFLVKCQRFVDAFQKPLLTPMLVKER